MTKKIQLIIGSTRQNRIAPQIASWVESQVIKNTDIELEVLDLKEINLPFFDEAISPAYGPVTSPQGKAWVDKVSSADGYIFLTPEYNHGYPAALKNAIDYLFHEWKGKPAAIVSYGYTDGGKSVYRQLFEIVDYLQMRVASDAINIHLTPENTDNKGIIADAETSFKQYEEGFQRVLTHLTSEKSKS